MNKDLKLCPFCGGEVGMDDEQITATITVDYFVCEKCGATVHFEYADSTAENIEAWNRRVTENKPRLIDANAYKEYLIETASICEGLGMHELGMMNRNLAQMVDNIPTAYDIDKVVEQLEEMQNFEMRTGKCYCPDANEEDCRYAFSDLSCAYCSIEKAIEIVKKGGVG